MGLDRAALAVFRPVGAGEEGPAADGATLRLPAVQQSGFQRLVQQLDGHTKLFTQQGVGNALNADARPHKAIRFVGVPIPIVQRDAVAFIIVAARPHQFPCPAVLGMAHDGNLFVDPVRLLSNVQKLSLYILVHFWAKTTPLLE